MNYSGKTKLFSEFAESKPQGFVVNISYLDKSFGMK